MLCMESVMIEPIYEENIFIFPPRSVLFIFNDMISIFPLPARVEVSIFLHYIKKSVPSAKKELSK